MKPLVVVAGPTASGKSDLAQNIAHELSGCVLSADSMQIYRGMDIGTGKVPRATASSNISGLTWSTRVNRIRHRSIRRMAVRWHSSWMNRGGAAWCAAAPDSTSARLSTHSIFLRANRWATRCAMRITGASIRKAGMLCGLP